MAAIATQTIELDLTPGGVSPFLYVSQGDYGTRNLVFNLMMNGQPYSVPSGVTTVSLEGITKGGDLFNVTCSFSGSTITASLTAGMTATVGMDICQIVLKNSFGRLGTANFFIVVEQSPTTIKVLYGNVYWSDLAKSWAVGGTDLRSDEATNNSKYWSNISKSFAETAELLSKSWAVGGTGKRSGENTNNSKYWSDTSKSWSEVSQNKSTLAESWAIGGTNTRPYEDTDNAKYYASIVNDVRPQLDENTNDISVLESLINQYVTPSSQHPDEVVNARVGFDGTTYQNLGTAIRSQVTVYGYIPGSEEIYFRRNS